MNEPLVTVGRTTCDVGRAGRSGVDVNRHSLLAGLASDLVAIVLLAYAVYFRRYHRATCCWPTSP